MQLTRPASDLVKAIFFGNYFYGLCVVGLSIEAGLQQRYPLNSFAYYCIAFIATVLYYTKAYLPSKEVNDPNPRTSWYARNRSGIYWSQWVLTIILAAVGGWYAWQHWDGILTLPLSSWVLLSVFPAVALLYYGIDQHYNLRNIGWLKPFIIGFSWAGVVTIYPLIGSAVELRGDHYAINFLGFLLFVKNLMFVSVLCIMFDIKDYAADSNQQIKTFVVKVGLRKTIFYIILPLSALGLASFLTYAVSRDFSSMKIFLNVIPFACLIIVAYSLHRRQSILYYLIAIDGLMLVKAVCGSIAMSFF